MGSAAPRLRDGAARRAGIALRVDGGVRDRGLRDRGDRGARARGGAAVDRPRVLSGHPRRTVGVDDPGAGLRPPALHGPRLAPRDGGTSAVAPRLPRLPAARRLGEPPRQRHARRAPRHAPGRCRAGDDPRPHLAPEPLPRRPPAAHRPRDAVLAGRDGALLPPAARRPAVREQGDRVALERARLGDAHLLRPRGDRRRRVHPRAAAAALLRPRRARA